MSNSALLSGLLILAFVQAIACTSHHHHNHHHQSAVVDTDGNELQAGTPYYIVSAIRGGVGGGVSVDRRHSSSSQGHQIPTVKQSSYDRNMGTPVMFSPASSQHPELQLQQTKNSAAGVRFLTETEVEGKTTIRESMDMNFGFSGMDNRVWQVEDRNDQSSGSSNRRYVTLNGKPGNPGESTIRNWFRIERMSEHNPIYRIAYCPNVCESCHVECGRVGINRKNGNRWLSISENGEFPFVFVRARQSQDISE
ncbi:hypothetical protein NE237_016104 [Protea cynaroides]|uniref:Uncharacterized protein n=1 Tax=Protea cynaroides TaxID=273540 RepID=A0A9Q0QRQ5_9MAGN|nr:hypothetical protein NE237_016104 [Protea cynaroides]